ncbi:uncharacterized protein LOC119394473 [Rhipicephalus sanguineus]|uniref:uncharacterized protein LOC119394473 n=1 Tax=Rhipicephalus sanguineus TaxID=34632 RepID=UPI00189625CB|nr:uncharacterized protein LOC119394473 [Rhipicephalus sanguineus]
MIPTVVIACLILAFAGHSASQDLDCSGTVECYTKLRKQTVRNVDALPGPEPTERNLAAYKYFCEVQTRWPSPCNRSEVRKDCFKRADIEAREKVYRELWNFVCSGNETTWTRFMGILFSTTNDPCQGALSATKQVLNGDLGKCGTLKQLFGECLSQKSLKTDILEPAMELLDCTQKEPVSTTTQRAPDAPADPQCDRESAADCLRMSVKALETSMGFENSDAQAGQSGCTPAPCLQKYSLDGCSHQEMMQLTSLENAIDAVRSAACGDDRALLKSIRLAASCWNVEEFKRCVGDSHIDLSTGQLSKEQCGSYTSSVHKCMEKSQKPCKHDVKSASKLSSAFFSAYYCYPEHDEIPAEKPTEKPKAGNSGPSLASSISLTLSFALVTALAIRR